MAERCDDCFSKVLKKTPSNYWRGAYEIDVESWSPATTWGEVLQAAIPRLWASDDLWNTARDQALGRPVGGTYILYECPECHEPVLVQRVVFEPFENEENPGRGYFQVVYPPNAPLNAALPKAVYRAIGEARAILETGAVTGAVLMCRRAIEAICDDQGVKSGSLMGQLKQLREQGLIDINLYQWADALRSMGNEAAHEFDWIVSEEDARDALQLTEAIADYLYADKERFSAFMQRRATKN